MAGRARRFRRWIIGGATVLVVLAFGGPFIYNHVTAGSAPAMLTLPMGQSGARSGAISLDGLWHAGPSSVVGFRVPTDALGYRGTVVGRTSKVWGSITISGASVSKGSFTVDMASVTSSSSARNILEVGVDPTATFVLTSPIKLAGTPVGGTVQHDTATGKLTLHGTTKSLTFTLAHERTGSAIYVLADIPIDFADWHISVPYGVESSGTLEVLLGLIQDAGNRS
jgi:polyisoprenoid-binding protein YceI